MMRHVMLLVTCGAAPGLVAAWIGTRFVSGVLFGVSPSDPATLGLALLVLVTVAAAAAYLPAHRAARRIDPVVALRGK